MHVDEELHVQTLENFTGIFISFYFIL